MTLQPASSHEQLPSWIDLERKVEMMESYVNAHFAVVEFMPVLHRFVRMVRLDLKTAKELSAESLTDPTIHLRVLLLKRKIQTCWQYFESGYQVYLRGAITDFPLDHQFDKSYIGSVRSILQVLNDIAALTFERCKYADEWNGFVTFSNTLNFKTAEASILILPFFEKHSVELVQDWLLISHEIGHVYFWTHPTLLKYSPRGEFGDEATHSLMDELLADFFGLEQAYELDIAHYCNDFNNIRSRFQDPARAGFFAQSYDARLIAGLIYSCARLDTNFAELLRQWARPIDYKYPLITRLADTHSDAVVDVLLKHNKNFAGKTRGTAIGYLWKEFIVGMLNTEQHWERRVGRESAFNIEVGIMRFIHNLATGKDEVFSRVHSNLSPKDRNAMREHAKLLADGHVTQLDVEAPLLLIREFIEYCSVAGVRLETEDGAAARAALILSLTSNSKARKFHQRERLAL